MTTNGWLRTMVVGSMMAITPIGWGQDAPMKKLAYDVVSVKPDTSGGGGMRMMITPDGFQADNVSLKMMMQSAYQYNQELIFGLPSWAETDRFDVKAKVAEEDLPALKKMAPPDRIKIVQGALEERFKVKVHRETKELPTYDLVIAKSGLKIKEAVVDENSPLALKGPDGKMHGGMMSMGRGMLKGQAIPMGNLIKMLSSVTQRTVVDKTGLKGIYDFELKWTPEDAPVGGADEMGPSIFTALQEQLGLRLDASKGMVETLIVDHAEKPSED